MATIRDIAQRSGVSKTTVARALNNDGYVSSAAREKIELAVKELNYTPNYMAKGMRTRKSLTLGFFVPDYRNPFYGELFSGVEAVTRKLGYINIMCHTDHRADLELFYVREMIKRQIDGIIFCTYNRNEKSEELLSEIAERVPIVCTDPVFDELDLSSVVSDGYAGTLDGVNRLVQMGCQRIAYVKGPRVHAVTTERFEGYKKGLENAGLTHDPRLVYESEDFTMDSGSHGVARLLEEGVEFDSLMAATDVLAIGALRELHRNAIEVPQRVKVVGFDNIPLAGIVQPTLTTISQPIFQMGVTAAELLVERIGDGERKPEHIVLPCEFIERGST